MAKITPVRKVIYGTIAFYGVFLALIIWAAVEVAPSAERFFNGAVDRLDHAIGYEKRND